MYCLEIFNAVISWKDFKLAAEENRSPIKDTKPSLSALIKAKPVENVELKVLYEHLILKNPSAEYKRHMSYPLNTFAAVENLVRLSL